MRPNTSALNECRGRPTAAVRETFAERDLTIAGKSSSRVVIGMVFTHAFQGNINIRNDCIWAGVCVCFLHSQCVCVVFRSPNLLTRITYVKIFLLHRGSAFLIVCILPTTFPLAATHSFDPTILPYTTILAITIFLILA